MLSWPKLKYFPILVVQLVLLIPFFLLTDYGAAKEREHREFEHIHVMIFVGFGFLMTFLKKYCYSALGLNWLLAALAIQWALLCQNFFYMENSTIYIRTSTLIEADIMAATVLITFGALLGITSPLQLLLICLFEVAIGCINMYIVTSLLRAADAGGSITIHTFGAYFGLGVSLALRTNKKESVEPEQKMNTPTYMSDVSAMIGSLFLWVFWPLFNSALTDTDFERNRAVINTYLSLAAATVSSYVVSAAVSHEPGKLDMVHVQNSTLAGGVAVGTVCNMAIGPGGALSIGVAAGVLSVLGYKYLTPQLEKLEIMDTCGVHNLHGMPGVLSGLISIAVASLATREKYGDVLYSVFPAMDPVDGLGRSAGTQALHQFYALIVTLGVALMGGFCTGFLAKAPVFEPLEDKDKYKDDVNWVLP